LLQVGQPVGPYWYPNSWHIAPMVIGWNTCWVSLFKSWNAHWSLLGRGWKVPSSYGMGVRWDMLTPAVSIGAVVLVAVWGRQPCHSLVGTLLCVAHCWVGALGSWLGALCTMFIFWEEYRVSWSVVLVEVSNLAVLSMVSRVWLALCVGAAIALADLGLLWPAKELGCIWLVLSVFLYSCLT